MNAANLSKTLAKKFTRVARASAKGGRYSLILGHGFQVRQDGDRAVITYVGLGSNEETLERLGQIQCYLDERKIENELDTERMAVIV